MSKLQLLKQQYKRPKLLWINFLLTATLLVCLILEVMPLPVLFTVAFAIAVMINYPNLEQQKERIASHAGNVLAVVSLVFAAGIFTGILSGTKMVDAMANSVVTLIPDALGPQLPIITALLSMPFTFSCLRCILLRGITYFDESCCYLRN